MWLWKGESLVAKGLECHCFSHSDLPVHNGSFMRMMMLLDIVSSGIE